jgi:hypothetical protein
MFKEANEGIKTWVMEPNGFIYKNVKMDSGKLGT